MTEAQQTGSGYSITAKIGDATTTVTAPDLDKLIIALEKSFKNFDIKAKDEATFKAAFTATETKSFNLKDFNDMSTAKNMVQDDVSSKFIGQIASNDKNEVAVATEDFFQYGNVLTKADPDFNSFILKLASNSKSATIFDNLNTRFSAAPPAEQLSLKPVMELLAKTFLENCTLTADDSINGPAIFSALRFLDDTKRTTAENSFVSHIKSSLSAENAGKLTAKLLEARGLLSLVNKIIDSSIATTPGNGKNKDDYAESFVITLAAESRTPTLKSLGAAKLLELQSAMDTNYGDNEEDAINAIATALSDIAKDQENAVLSDVKKLGIVDPKKVTAVLVITNEPGTKASEIVKDARRSLEQAAKADNVIQETLAGLDATKHEKFAKDLIKGVTTESADVGAATVTTKPEKPGATAASSESAAKISTAAWKLYQTFTPDRLKQLIATLPKDNAERNDALMALGYHMLSDTDPKGTHASYLSQYAEAKAKGKELLGSEDKYAKDLISKIQKNSSGDEILAALQKVTADAWVGILNTLVSEAKAPSSTVFLQAAADELVSQIGVECLKAEVVAAKTQTKKK